MADNDEYTDEYNDEYLCRDFFVGFNFWSSLSFQISKFRVHCLAIILKGHQIQIQVPVPIYCFVVACSRFCAFTLIRKSNA